MVTRRRFIQAAAAIPALFGNRLSVAETPSLPSLATPDPTQPAFFDLGTGQCIAVPNPTAWCIANAHTPLLSRARERLELSDSDTEQDRVLRVVLRRCGLLLLEQRGSSFLAIQYWKDRSSVIDSLRPYFREHGLATPEVIVALINRKREQTDVVAGDRFLYGDPVNDAFPWEEFRQKWESRHQLEADDDQQSAGVFCVKFAGPYPVSWSTLKECWSQEEGIPHCQNCDEPLVVAGRRGHGRAWRVCLNCQRSFEDWPKEWLATRIGPHGKRTSICSECG